MPPPRLVPHRSFPPSVFVPGRGPHPESDPAGYHFGRGRLPAAPLDPSGWRQHETYLFGIDLFNAGYYWEAHAEFERLWLAAGRRGEHADFLKGLIQLAAAGVKHQEGVAAGVASHARRAAELFRASGEALFGLRPALLADLAAAVAQGGWPEGLVALEPVGGE
jgi:hypothetical protein